MYDRYSCQGNNNYKQLQTLKAPAVILRNCKLCIILYNVVYLHKLYFKIEYRIMQIIRGGKVSWLADLSVIRGKTFAIVQQFETPYNKKDKNSLENLRDWRLIRENRESFPPRTICIIRYGNIMRC